MKSYLDILLPDGNRVYEPNDLFQFEISRVFRKLVLGSDSGVGGMAADPFFRGAHVYNVLRGRYPYIGLVGLDNPAIVTNFAWSDVMRFRGRATSTITNPGYPTQKSFVMSRIYSNIALGFTPAANLSSIDINLRQIGTTYSHSVTTPIAQRAWFNVPGDVPFATGTGIVTPSGPFAPAPGEEGHYIYDVRIKDSVTGAGPTGTAEYVWRRRPYYLGSYEVGSGRSDFYAGYDLSERLHHQNNRANLDIGVLGVTTAAPNPSTVPYTLNYPTSAVDTANHDARCVGMCWDGLPDGRIWWITTNGDANYTARSLWTWKKMTSEAFQRADDAMTGSDPAIVTGWPVFGATALFRDIKAGRGGYLYLAADGTDDAGTGTDSQGSLIQIDANTGSMVVLNTFTSAQTGLAVDSVVAVTVDKNENGAPPGFDRVWILTRGGLAYTDVNIATGANPGGWVIAFNAGIPISANSQRGLGGFSFSSWPANRHAALMDVDGAGNVYWVSAPVSTTPVCIHRINKIDSAATTTSFISLDNVAEVGAAGYLQIGAAAAGNSVYQCSALIVHRRDPGDPYSDDLWVSSGNWGTVTSVTRLNQQIPLADPYTTPFTGVNPGFVYYGSEFRSQNAGSGNLQVSPDGSIWSFTHGNLYYRSIALLESIGRDVMGGVGASLTSLGAGVYTLVSAGTEFLSTDVDKVIHITDTLTAGNAGRYKITGFTSTSTVTVTATTTVSDVTDIGSFNWAVDRFDSRSGTDGVGTPGTWINTWAVGCDNPAFVDDSGIGYFFYPFAGSQGRQEHMLNFQVPVSYQWDSGGAQWYRSRFPTVATTRAKTTHGTTDALASGIEVTFGDGAGPIHFLTEEYYNWVVSMGLIKDATQEVTYSLDFYAEKTDLILDEITPATIRTATAMPSGLAVGALEAATLASVLTTSPFLFDGTGTGGAGDFISNVSGPTFSLTIAAAPWATLISGGFLTISGAANYSNNGTFPITLVPGAGTIQYTNASGTPEANFAGDYATSHGPSGFTVTDSPAKQAEVSYHERRFLHDGAVANQTTSIEWIGTVIDTVNGVTYGIKFTTDQAVAALRFALKELGDYNNLQIGLYSATSVAGPEAWTERAVYRADQDHPDWNIAADGFHNATSSLTMGTAPLEIEIDVASLMGGVAASGSAGGADTIGGAAPNMTLNIAAAPFDVTMVGREVTITGSTTPANDGTFPITAFGAANSITYTNVSGNAENWFSPGKTYSVGGIVDSRYWKLFINLTDGTHTLNSDLVGVVAYDSSGFPIDVPTDNYLPEATASNYMANMALRATWVQDTGTLTASRGPANDQATLGPLIPPGPSAPGDVINPGAVPPFIGPTYMDLTLAVPPPIPFTPNMIGHSIIISGLGPPHDGVFQIVNTPLPNVLTYINPAAPPAPFPFFPGGSYLVLDAFEVAFNGSGVGVDAITIGPPTLTIAAAPFDTAVVGPLIGRYVTIAGATAPQNNGTFPITGNPVITSIEYTNPYAVAQANFAGTYSIDGVAPVDFMRVYIPASGTNISAPVEEIQNLIVGAPTFVLQDLGRVIEITSAAQVTNNGVFQITRVVSATEIQYRNGAGLLDTTSTISVYREYAISTVDSTTQVTFTADAEAFTAESWEVVRNADVRPRDDEGGGENVARIPELSGEVFVCPVTGHIWYAAIDVLRGRAIHLDKYVKVLRAI